MIAQVQQKSFAITFTKVLLLLPPKSLLLNLYCLSVLNLKESSVTFFGDFKKDAK